MKRVIIMFVLIAATFISSVYAFIQKTAARASQKQAEMNLELAIAARKEADANATETVRQQKIGAIMLEEALRKCQEKNN